MLGKRILSDIQSMEKKSLNISLLKDENSDFTFFNIDDDENDHTLRTLKQSYVTKNYKEETILNLQKTLESEGENINKEIKIESYKKFNEALDLANDKYITDALNIIEQANEMNGKDKDILNLKGLLYMLKCDFTKAIESFYTSMCYERNEIATTYVDILSSEDFKVILSRYNHCIRFINEDLNQESINILINILDENPEFIEPYVILILLYRKLNNKRKEIYYLKKLEQIDKSNDILKEESKDDKEDKEVKKDSTKTKKILAYSMIGLITASIVFYVVQRENKINSLKEELVKKEDHIVEVGQELDKKQEELEKTTEKLNEKDEKIVKQEQEIKQKNEEIEKKNEQIESAKNKETKEMDEVKAYENAVRLKNVESYEDSIKYFKKVVENGKSEKYIKESTYQVASLSEKINDDETAKKYYKKYINTYTKNDEYYDESFYNLAMIYYNEGDLQKAKDTLYGLRYEVPDSIYNNSTVKEILSK